MAQRAPSSDRDAFASRLRAARQARGYSQTQLAALIGVSLPRYHAWERASATPSRINLYRNLCRHLDVTVDWLFFGDVTGLSAETRSLLGRF